jgi:hypothetical protein
MLATRGRVAYLVPLQRRLLGGPVVQMAVGASSFVLVVAAEL